ncbi:MAG: glutaminyl-peptide cyclotransferase [Nibricoccus sp.]
MKNANPVYRRLLFVVVVAFAFAGCSKNKVVGEPSIPASPVWDRVSAPPKPVRYTYEVVSTWPHDRNAFTQGLLFQDGSLLESTGLNGASSLREVNIETGKPLKMVTLSPVYFAEGLAVLGERAYQLTWQNQRCFVYNAHTFQALGEFKYDGEGWGLTTDGQVLIMSDGTSRLRFLDPQTFLVVRTVDVTLEGIPQAQLNELEYINGEIFANVWQTDQVVRIDPQTGVVRGVIDFSGLLSLAERTADVDVLNGIAYDSASRRLFVTGKRWPTLFEVRLKALP